MHIIPTCPDVTVPCGICKKEIKPTQLRNPIPVSKWDKMNGYVRQGVYNCCNKIWLKDLYGNSEEQGKAVIEQTQTL